MRGQKEKKSKLESQSLSMAATREPRLGGRKMSLLMNKRENTGVGVRDLRFSPDVVTTHCMSAEICTGGGGKDRGGKVKNTRQRRRKEEGKPDQRKRKGDKGFDGDTRNVRKVYYL